jgi:hypothetical protein
MRASSVILALAALAAAIPLGCARDDPYDRGMPPPAYRTAREVYVRPAEVPGSEPATTESVAGERYDTGDYVTADRNGPDAVTYDGSYSSTYHGAPYYDGTLSPYLRRDYEYAGSPYSDPFYDPFYSSYPYYGYPYGFYSGFYGRQYGSRYYRDYRRDHDYVRRDDVHYPRDARRDGDRSRNDDRSPREPSPRSNDRGRVVDRNGRPDVHEPVRQADRDDRPTRSAERGNRDVNRAEQNRRATDDAAGARTADRPRDPEPDRTPRNIQSREQKQDEPRRAPTRSDPPREDRPARSDPPRREAPRDDPPRQDRPARGGTDSPPARNDAPRQERPSRGGTDDPPRRR